MKTKLTSKITSNAAAPAAKPAPSARKKAAAPATPAAIPAPVPAPTVVPAAAPAAVATPKVAFSLTKLPETIIAVKVDVGFGNQVFVRGEGAGLSWDKGVPAENVASDLWKIELKGATRPVKFKVLVNDTAWSAGDDYAVEPGQSVTLTPAF